MDRILIFLVGAVFAIGGCYIAKCSLEAKNFLEVALFGIMGFSIGLFLVIVAVTGPPNY
jgi:drug/metabolite transporter superfamily protein YnfA